MNVLMGAFLFLACAQASGGVSGERELRGTDPIGRRGNALIYSVSGMSVDERGNFYVTDLLEYAVKKFDSRGNFIGRTGRRGGAPGEFRAPSLSVASGGRLVVVQVEDPRIEVFDTGLVFRNEFSVSGGWPVDLSYAGRGAFALALCGDSTAPEVLLYRFGNPAATRRFRLAPTGYRHPLYTAVRIAVSPGGNIVAAYLFMNRVETYSTSGRLLRRFALGPMPSGTGNAADRRIPEDTYFRKVLIDRRGNIVLLGGNQAPHPGRDLFICSPSGNLIHTFVLPCRPRTVAPGPAHMILATDENGTGVIAYTLRY